MADTRERSQPRHREGADGGGFPEVADGGGRHREGADGGGFPVLVRVPQDLPSYILKVQKYFNSKSKSGGEDTCKVTELSPTTYRVCFHDREALNRVLQKKDHVIDSVPVEVTIGEGDLHHSHRSTRTRDLPVGSVGYGSGDDYGGSGRPRPPESDDRSISDPTEPMMDPRSRAGSAGGRSAPITEIFTDVSAQLHPDLIHSEILHQIPHKFPSLKMIKLEDGLEVRGSFLEVKKMYDFLQMQLGGGDRSPIHDEERGEEGDDWLNLQTPLYEYITEIYNEEITKMEKRYKVEVKEVEKSKNITYIKLIPQAPDSSVDRAKQIFIDKVYAVTKDWSQKEAPISAMKASLEDTKHYMKERHKTLVLVEGDRVILRGPDRELALAVEAFQKVEGRSLPPRRVITISSRDTKNEVIVDARHMDILKKLKYPHPEYLTHVRDELKAKGVDSDLPTTTTRKEEEKCPICLDQMRNKKVLPKCKHEFCADCLQQCLNLKPVCPVCSAPYGVVIGIQPDGTMTHTTSAQRLPGYPGCGSIQIQYSIPGGVQQKNHPNPGKPFHGTHRTAYLPDNREGREVLHLLRKAFDQKLVFTVGESRTTGAKDTLTWNDIPHKTSTYGGPAGFGYPDPEYLTHVRDELKAKGVE